jgi:DNA (cytosine-5)-methyltransferase 1
MISLNNFANIMGVSRHTVEGWVTKGTYVPAKSDDGQLFFDMDQLRHIPVVREMIESSWEEEKEVKPLRPFTSIELFAGAGGLALGFAKAGFTHVMLNEFNHVACETLRNNRPDWNVIEGDVHEVDFTPWYNKIDLLTGGFPCQAFSYAGNKGGFEDARGTLFFEVARAVKEINPKVFVCENVKGLASHDNGKTLKVIKNVIRELGYTLVTPRVLEAIRYQVPQKRERIILVAIRNDLAPYVKFHWPAPYHRIMTLRDAFFGGELYPCDVPTSEGAKYPKKKEEVLRMVPQGGDWRSLPDDVAQQYMGASYYLGGGKTGMARRLSMDEPSLTLTCSPAQKQTERCHPIETRPLTVREYARIQTFPDEWQFAGSIAEQYKQIGNAVPVNLAWAVARSVIRLLNDIETFEHEGKKIREIDFSAVRTEYPQTIFQHPDSDPLPDESKDLLISLVPNANVDRFLDGSANVYYTGKKFPSTVKLNHLYYFMPYVKGKGVRDLYYIKVARVGTKAELTERPTDKDDMRLVFELKFIKTLFKEYKPVDLKIWHTFTDTTLEAVMKL